MLCFLFGLVDVVVYRLRQDLSAKLIDLEFSLF